MAAEKLQKYYSNANWIFLEAICFHSIQITWSHSQDSYLFLKFIWIDLYTINNFMYVHKLQAAVLCNVMKINGKQCYKMFLNNAHHPFLFTLQTNNDYVSSSFS